MVDFIGIGAQKAGTTWLWEMLRQHPKAYFGPVKEVHYFDVLYLGAGRSRRLTVFGHGVDRLVARLEANDTPRETIERLIQLKDPSFAFTDAWYDQIFADAPPGAISGDISPYYCALPDEGIEHIKRVAPKARLIYLIRDPVQRAVSSVRQLVNEDKSVEHVLNSQRYFLRGDYRSNIARWDRHYPGGRLLFIPFGDIKNRPGDVLRTVEKHLGLPPFDGYEGMTVPRRSTADNDLAMPAGVEERIADIFAGQKDFLRQRFGDDFVSRIA